MMSAPSPFARLVLLFVLAACDQSYPLGNSDDASVSEVDSGQVVSIDAGARMDSGVVGRDADVDDDDASVRDAASDGAASDGEIVGDADSGVSHRACPVPEGALGTSVGRT